MERYHCILYTLIRQTITTSLYLAGTNMQGTIVGVCVCVTVVISCVVLIPLYAGYMTGDY